MLAVLVARVEDDKLYYILDASEAEKDAILVRPDNSMIKVDLFDFCNSCGGLLKMRTSKFHKFLWDGFSSKKSNIWKETFIEKSRPVNEKLMDGLEIYSALGENKKKIDTTTKKAKDFKKTINTEKTSKIKTKSLGSGESQPCCDDEMVKFDISNLVFKSRQARKEAWTAMILLRQLEENNND